MSTKDKLTEDESFVSRWSRRKQDAASPAETPVAEPPAEPSIPLNTVMPIETRGRMQTGVEADRIKAEKLAGQEGAAVLTDEDMPDTDSLGEGSDYTGFMSPGVSASLRKVALRKLFAGAGFNIRDGLDDYDEDFTNFEPLGDIITSDMKHREEMKEVKRKRDLADAEAAEQKRLEEEGGEEIESLEAEEEPQEIAARDERPADEINPNDPPNSTPDDEPGDESDDEEEEILG